jgi:transcriptional regulator with XRE-family HTH domain
MEFKDNLKKLRETKGISQQQLASDIFVSRSAIAKWENGLGLPNKESLQYLCDYFGVEEEELIPEKHYENSLIDKNKKILKLKLIIFSTTFFALIVTSIFLRLLMGVHQDERFNNHNVPPLTINGIETNFCRKGYEYIENENGDIVYQSYIIKHPPIYIGITKINKAEKYTVEVNLSREIFGIGYYLDDNYKIYGSDSPGRLNLKPFDLEIKNGEFSLPNKANDYPYTLIVLYCSFGDLFVSYFYVVDMS